MTLVRLPRPVGDIERGIRSAQERVSARERSIAHQEAQEKLVRDKAKGTEQEREKRIRELVASAKKRLTQRMIEQKEKEIKELTELIERQPHAMGSLKIVNHLDPLKILSGGFSDQVPASRDAAAEDDEKGAGDAGLQDISVAARDLSVTERAKKVIAIERDMKKKAPTLITKKKDRDRLRRLIGEY